MIDHISVAVRDLKTAEAFYSALLAPLGMTKLREWPDAAIGFGKKYPEFWINKRAGMDAVAADSGVHICLRAADAAAVTRVLIESEDENGDHWTTIGVSPNIIDASFQALMDSIIYKLVKSGAPA